MEFDETWRTYAAYLYASLTKIIPASESPSANEVILKNKIVQFKKIQKKFNFRHTDTKFVYHVPGHPLYDISIVFYAAMCFPEVTTRRTSGGSNSTVKNIKSSISRKLSVVELN